MEDESLRRRRVLVVPFPAQGHIAPLVHISRRLSGQGFCITIANIQSIHQQLVSTVPDLPNHLISLEALPCQFSAPHGSQVSHDPILFMEALLHTKSSLHALIQRFLDNKEELTCIIVDYFMDFVVDLADSLKIPVAIYWPGSATWSCVDYYLPLLIPVNDLEVENEICKRVPDIPGVKPLAAEDLSEYQSLSRIPGGSFLEKCRRRSSNLNLARWILVNSFPELEPYAVQAMQEKLGSKYMPIGFLFPINQEDTSDPAVSLRKETKTCLEWLDSRPKSSVLYIAFGSRAKLTISEFEELAEGLIASKVAFLFVVHKDLIEGEAAEAKNRLLRSAEERGMVISWAPQIRVLRHEAIAGFMSHCGWNSCLESICCGKAVLGMPWMGDQDLNCRFMAKELGIGVKIGGKIEGLKREKIKMGIQQFFENKEMQKRAQDLGHMARIACGPSGSSSSNFREFVSQLSNFMLT